MDKLDRYIGSSVFVAILAVLGIILGLATLFAFIDEMSEVSDTYTLVDVLSYVLLTAPRRLYDMLPMAALIGCLIGLGSLASHSELTIMRAAGVSIGRIVWAVMKPMLILMVVGVLIGEYVAPATEVTAQANRSLAQGGGDAQSAKHGLWHRQGMSSFTSTRYNPTVCCTASPVIVSTMSVICCLPASPNGRSSIRITGS